MNSYRTNISFLGNFGLVTTKTFGIDCFSMRKLYLIFLIIAIFAAIIDAASKKAGKRKSGHCKGSKFWGLFGSSSASDEIEMANVVSDEWEEQQELSKGKKRLAKFVRDSEAGSDSLKGLKAKEQRQIFSGLFDRPGLKFIQEHLTPDREKTKPPKKSLFDDDSGESEHLSPSVTLAFGEDPLTAGMVQRTTSGDTSPTLDSTVTHNSGHKSGAQKEKEAVEKKRKRQPSDQKDELDLSEDAIDRIPLDKDLGPVVEIDSSEEEKMRSEREIQHKEQRSNSDSHTDEHVTEHVDGTHSPLQTQLVALDGLQRRRKSEPNGSSVSTQTDLIDSGSLVGDRELTSTVTNSRGSLELAGVDPLQGNNIVVVEKVCIPYRYGSLSFRQALGTLAIIRYENPRNGHGLWLSGAASLLMIGMIWHVFTGHLSCCFGPAELKTLALFFLGLFLSFFCYFIYRVHVATHDHPMQRDCWPHVIEFFGGLLMAATLHILPMYYVLSYDQKLRYTIISISLAIFAVGITVAFTHPYTFRSIQFRSHFFTLFAVTFGLLHLFTIQQRGWALFVSWRWNLYFLGTIFYWIANALLYYGPPSWIHSLPTTLLISDLVNGPVLYIIFALVAVFFFYAHLVSVLNSIVVDGY